MDRRSALAAARARDRARAVALDPDARIREAGRIYLELAAGLSAEQRSRDEARRARERRYLVEALARLRG